MQRRKRILAIFTCIALLAGATGCQKHEALPPACDPAAREAAGPRVESIIPRSRHDLHRYFLEYGYDWNTVAHGVPPLVVEKFPEDFYELAAGSERTRIFYLTLLPMVLLVNDEILAERNRLIELFARIEREEALSDAEIEVITAAARSYRVGRDPLIDRQARTLLLNRIDVIPPSLALAQAASESAYGTSRFARLGNNLFGEMVFKEDAAGIVSRAEGAKYKARIFPSLLDSFRAYMTNLNTHPAYGELRQLRAEMRSQGEEVRGIVLARGLRAYSERSEAYIDDIRTIIQTSNLSRLTANATLRNAEQRLPNSPSRSNPAENRPAHPYRPIKKPVVPNVGHMLLSQN